MFSTLNTVYVRRLDPLVICHPGCLVQHTNRKIDKQTNRKQAKLKNRQMNKQKNRHTENKTNKKPTNMK